MRYLPNFQGRRSGGGIDVRVKVSPSGVLDESWSSLDLTQDIFGYNSLPVRTRNLNCTIFQTEQLSFQSPNSRRKPTPIPGNI